MHDSGEIAPRERGLMPLSSHAPLPVYAKASTDSRSLGRRTFSEGGKPGEDAGENGCLKFKSGKIAGCANHDCKIKFSSISRKLK